MRKLIVIVLAVLMVLTFSGCSSNEEKETLKVYSPGVYIDPTLISEFEDEFDCRVIYENFDSNEMMYTKFMSGDEYDVLVPSDYMIERLIEEDQLQKLDRSLITNYDGLMDGVLHKEFDINNEYAIPYFWGTVGLLYNTQKVDQADLENDGWDILLNEKYKGRIYFYDSERDAFMIAFKALGYSMNSDDEKEIDEAYQWLLKMAETMEPVYATDDAIDSMVAGNRDIAVMYSGDSAYVMTENEDMSFYMPKEGTNVWVDGMVITKNSKNVELAHEWINFMIREDVAAKNSSYVGYSSPVQSVYDEMSGEGGEYEGNIAYIPRLGYEMDESFNNNEVLRKKVAELWTRVKSSQ